MSSMAGTMSSLRPRHLRVVSILMYCMHARRDRYEQDVAVRTFEGGNKDHESGRTYIIVFAMGHEVCCVAVHFVRTTRQTTNVPFPQSLVELFARNAGGGGRGVAVD